MAATQGTAARLIEVATKEIGTIEGPKENQTKYGAYTKANFQPWCGSFVMWCANEAGVKIPNCVFTPAGAASFKKSKQWHEDAPQAGDIVFFDFPHDGLERISHVGIVVKDNKDGTVTTIEGNTAGNSIGDQRNGGEVAKKVRAYKANKKGIEVSIVGFGRPKYGAVPAPAKPVKPINPAAYPGRPIEPGEAGEYIKVIQKKLLVKPVDGHYGPQTKKAVIAWQKKHPKLGAADGIIGPLTWKALTK